MTAPPPRGFPDTEFHARLERAQRLMHQAGLGALMLTTEPEVRWFSGFLTPFWQSPTRPWFLIVPARRRPIAVIPSIGAPAMARTWIEDIRTWDAPAPSDDGVSLLRAALSEVGGPIGVAMGRESHLRMPLGDFAELAEGLDLRDATPILNALRHVKSEAEIAKIRHAAQCACDAFDRVPHIMRPGMGEDACLAAFRIAGLQAGLDEVAYLVGAAGPGGYDDIISPPSQRPLTAGDVLIMDVGGTYDGYYCDFDRNFSIGAPADETARAHEVLWQTTEAGLAAARPGAAASDVFDSMAQHLGTNGFEAGNVGRLGHGLGMQLTEHPSLTSWDRTVLEPGVVLTLEPGLTIAPGRMLVHEENIVIRDGPPELLTRRAPRELPVIA